MNRSGWSAALGALGLMIGCGQSGPPAGTSDGSVDSTVRTVLEGRLHDALRGSARRVEVVDLVEGARGAVRCETMSTRDGQWSCDLGPLSGHFLVKVDTMAGAPLTAVVDQVGQGDTRRVVITPFTHLTAAYLEARESKEEPFEPALLAARRLIHGHFGDISHHRSSPATLELDQSTALDEPVVSAVLLRGLDTLASDVAAESGQGSGGTIDVWHLLSALAADIRADGVFDGRGPQGELRLGGVALDGDTLRARYGRALLAWVVSEANPTSFGRADFEPLAQRLSSNTTEIFPEDVPMSLDDAPPMIVRVEVAKDPGDPLPTGSPIGGSVFVTVEASDPSGIGAFELVEATGADVVGEGERLGRNGMRWIVDGSRLVDGTHRLELVVVDGAGNTAARSVALVTDNTPPLLRAMAAGRSRSSTITVSGEVEDAIGPVDTLTVSTIGRSPVVLASPDRFWSAVAELPCDGADHMVEVRAVDRAGNAAVTEVEAGCDDSPPSLQVRRTEFFDGDQVVARYAPDGQALGYEPVEFPAATEVATEGPHVFVKYFNRLDATSPELPVLAVIAADDRGPAQLSVRYRYLVEGVVVRGWTIAETANRFDWSVPVSYQHLGPQLATAGPAAVHRVEVRASDAAGHRTQLAFSFQIQLRSPPVWIGGCEVHPTLQSYTLPRQNLHEVFLVRSSTPVQLGQLRYLLGLPRSSLASRGDLRVRVTSTDVRSYLDVIRLDGHARPTPERIPWSQALGLTCPVGEHRLWVGAVGSGVDLGCRAGAFPLLGRPWRSRAADGLLNDDFAHATSASMSRAGGAVRVDGAHFLMEPEQPHGLAVHVDNPVIRIGGQPYAWPTALGLPNGFAANGTPPRYRGFPSWEGEGVDVLRHWIGSDAGQDVRRFVTRPYVFEVSFEMEPVQLEVLHGDLDVEVPIEFAPECLLPLGYRTSL